MTALTFGVTAWVTLSEESSISRDMVSCKCCIILDSVFDSLVKVGTVDTKLQPVVSSERHGHEDQGDRSKNCGDDDQSCGTGTHACWKWHIKSLYFQWVSNTWISFVLVFLESAKHVMLIYARISRNLCQHFHEVINISCSCCFNVYWKWQTCDVQQCYNMQEVTDA